MGSCEERVSAVQKYSQGNFYSESVGCHENSSLFQCVFMYLRMSGREDKKKFYISILSLSRLQHNSLATLAAPRWQAKPGLGHRSTLHSTEQRKCVFHGNVILLKERFYLCMFSVWTDKLRMYVPCSLYTTVV